MRGKLQPHPAPTMADYTRWLNSSTASRDEEMFAGLYAELHKIARGRMAAEREGQTLDATGLVHEVFTFDEDFQSFMYEGHEDLFAPDQDPTDPDEVPFDDFDFAGGPIKRLNHVD